MNKEPQEKQIVKGANTEQKFEPGSLEEQDNFLIEMLSSDKIIDIAIFVCFLGVIILGYCCYLVEGHLRFHLGFILILMFGLGISLIIYKCLNAQAQKPEENQESTQESQTQKSSKSPSKKSKKPSNSGKKASKGKEQKIQ